MSPLLVAAPRAVQQTAADAADRARFATTGRLNGVDLPSPATVHMATIGLRTGLSSRTTRDADAGRAGRSATQKAAPRCARAAPAPGAPAGRTGARKAPSCPQIRRPRATWRT